jgi:hypothetical protein
MKGNAGSQVAEKPANLPSPWPMPGANDLLDCWVDAWQRSILLLDVLRQRGNNSIEHTAWHCQLNGVEVSFRSPLG